MAGWETRSSARNFGVLLGLFAVASWSNSAISSFHPVYAPLKLAVGLLHLVAIGHACSGLLRLQRPRVLASAHDALLGQVAYLAYFYLRSTASDLLGLPGLSPAEAFLTEAVLLATAWRRSRPGASMRSPDARRVASSLALQFLWLAWLFAVALQKLDLFYTPSSDPDIHAFYARAILERGHVYYDLLPNSDAGMVYPSGFASLNFVLGRLSGLHPVQLVNIAAYLQFTLFAGAGFSLLASSIRRRSWTLPLALLHFGVAYLGFNAVFGEQRSFLEGTPRLAHTALLFFPLLFALQHRSALATRSWLWALPLAAAAVGMCINPAHAPASALVAVAAFAATRFSRGQPTNAAPRRSGARLVLVAAAIVATVPIVSSDPFYRSLVSQQSVPAAQRERATDLTGAAFTRDIDLGALISHAAPAAMRNLVAAPDAFPSQQRARMFLLAATLLTLAAWLASARSAAPAMPAESTRLLRYLGAATGTLLLHAIWSEVAAQLGRPGILQARLLTQYTHSLQQQLLLMFYSMLPGVLSGLWLGFLHRQSKLRPAQTRRRNLATAIGLLALSLPFLRASQQEHHSQFYARLRESPLGQVYASDVDFARRVGERVARDERILLPGRLRRFPGEHWVFSVDAGRAIPLFSDVKTSFFLGLDGRAYTAGAYEAHVEPPSFDAQWLRAENVVWLLESGNFPAQILRAHYQRILGDDHAVLWRLRR